MIEILIEKHIDGQEAIGMYQGDDRFVHFTEYEQIKSTGLKPVVKMYTNKFLKLDQLLDGFETGELMTITGPTGNGKTLLAESIGISLMSQGVGAAWFSFEVPTVKMIKKYVDPSLGLYVPLELKPGNFQWVIERSLEAKIKFNCRVVIIDHLHFLVDMDTKQNMSLNIGGVLRQLKKNVAVDMNLFVILLAHQTQGNDDKEPGLNTIRDSSFIGQESDTVLTVYRTPDPDNMNSKYGLTFEQGWSTIKVDKARRSGVYRKKVAFRKDGDWLSEVDL